MVDAVAAVTPEAGAPFAVQTIEVAEPQKGEVMVAVKAVGVCHTDLIAQSGAFETVFPAVFGHEGAGVVVKVGAGVTKVKPGDKVLMTFNSCGACRQCGGDAPAYCESFVPLNLPAVREDGESRLSKDGQKISDNFFGQSSFCSRAIAKERNIVPVPKDADLSLLASLGCGVQTGAGAVMNSLEAKEGQSLVVIGGGSVGLSAALAGKIVGCAPVIVVEPKSERRELAAELGVDHAIDPSAADLVEVIQSIIPGGADLIVDTSANVEALTAAIGFAGARGKIALIGVPNPPETALPLPLFHWTSIGGTVRGVVEGDSDPDVFIPALVEHVQAGRLPIGKMISTYPFEKINEAIGDAHSGKAVKVVLTFPET